MPIARNLPVRCLRQLRASRPAIRQSVIRPSGRRGYATAEDMAGKAKDAANKAKETAKQGLGSEITWLAGALAVTVPGAYFILNGGDLKNPLNYPMPGSHYHGGGHGEGHEEHEEEEHDEGEDKEGEEEENKDESKESDDSEEKDGDKSEDKGDDSEDESKDDDSKDNSADDSKDSDKGGDDDNKRTELGKPGEKEGKSMSNVPSDNKISKKPVDGGSGKFDEKQELEHDVEGGKKLHVPDAKGGAKRRIESPRGNKLGKESEETADSDVDDPAAQSKEPKKGFESMSGKQEGLSNTDTKHSVKIDEMDDKSKKAEGGPDTAKLKGTVDPNRPAK